MHSQKKKIVTKFGGSSLANAEQFRKVKDIIGRNPARIYVVPSAPGRRFSGDDKVTDLLYRCYNLCREHQDFEETFDKIRRGRHIRSSPQEGSC